jgi:hypothetical protein
MILLIQNKSIKAIDYIVKKRNTIENLFDFEVRDPDNQGYFYEG